MQENRDQWNEEGTEWGKRGLYSWSLTGSCMEWKLQHGPREGFFTGPERSCLQREKETDNWFSSPKGNTPFTGQCRVLSAKTRQMVRVGRENNKMIWGEYKPVPSIAALFRVWWEWQTARGFSYVFDIFLWGTNLFWYFTSNIKMIHRTQGSQQDFLACPQNWVRSRVTASGLQFTTKQSKVTNNLRQTDRTF